MYHEVHACFNKGSKIALVQVILTNNKYIREQQWHLEKPIKITTEMVKDDLYNCAGSHSWQVFEKFIYDFTAPYPFNKPYDPKSKWIIKLLGIFGLWVSIVLVTDDATQYEPIK